SDNIIQTLSKVLEDFEIRKGQIYSAATDNRSNFVKAFSDLDQDYTSAEILDDDNLDVNESEETTDEEINDECDVMDTVGDTYCVEFLRCAAHTLQLAVLKFLKNSNNQKIILSARKLVRILRTPNVRYVLASQGKSPPVINVETRWSSTHDMLDSLLKLKETCIELENSKVLKTNLTPHNWNCVENLVALLKPAKVTTMIFQNEFLTAREFYESWTKLKFDIEAHKNPQSKLFLDLIEIRKNQLLQQDAILAALYMYPRYKSLVNPSDVPRVREFIISVAKKRRLLLIRQENESDEYVASIDLEIPGCAGDPYESLLVSSDRTMRTDARVNGK
ncbi:unnamed protein product, partial [Allacma fusca]